MAEQADLTSGVNYSGGRRLAVCWLWCTWLWRCDGLPHWLGLRKSDYERRRYCLFYLVAESIQHFEVSSSIEVTLDRWDLHSFGSSAVKISWVRVRNGPAHLALTSLVPAHPLLPLFPGVPILLLEIWSYAKFDVVDSAYMGFL